MKRALSLAVLVMVGCATTTKAPTPVAEKASPVAVEVKPPALRLPEGVKPMGYQLELKVVPGQDTFSGVAHLTIDVEKPTDVIWLHATELVIQSAEVVVTAGAKPLAAQTQLFPPDFLRVSLPQALPTGKATLRFFYSGALSARNRGGVFQLNDRGENYVYTQFEATDARRALPCFDEPRFKVPFEVTLTVKKEHLAFSNNPVSKEEALADGFKRISFTATKPLPTYLLAFAVGPFEVVNAGAWGKNKTPVRIIVTKGKSAEAHLAAQMTGPILEAHEKYFDIPYPYEKLDQIALPTGFGAMENAGLVTYGHDLILVPPNEETPARRRAFASVCSHELAHQWFGNLVTMKWWDDIWLNEGFANWMGDRTLKTWKPEWGIEVDRVHERNQALLADSLVSARQVRQPIETHDDIDNVFDAITYNKGAAVIQMNENLVGAEAFQKGVRRYLNEHAHGNGTATDFIAAITQESHTDVSNTFGSFLDQPGAPVVAVNLSCPKGAAPKLTFAQRRYLPLGSTGESKQTWALPVCVRYSVGGKQTRLCTLLSQPEEEKVLEGVQRCPEWVMPNDGMFGYYRSQLGGESDTVKLLKAAGKKLSTGERLGLVSDLDAAVKAGQAKLEQALAVLPLIKDESNHRLVKASMGLVSMLNARKLVSDAQLPNYQAFVRHTFGPLAAKTGFTVAAKDTEDTRLLRPALLSLVGKDGNDATLQAKALSLAKTWVRERKGVDPELLDSVMAVAARTNDPELHAQLQHALRAEKEKAQRNYLLEALGAFSQPTLVKAHLPLALDPSVEGQEALGIIWSATDEPRTQDVGFDFLKENWDPLLKRLPADWGANLVHMASGFCDAQHRDATSAFFESRASKLRGGARPYANVMERIDLCIKYKARYQPEADAFLAKWKPNASGR